MGSSDDAMDRDTRSTGWAYWLEEPVAGIGASLLGHVAESSGEENVRQSIWLILGTALGERVQRPDFGCAIHDLLFAPIGPLTTSAAADAVKQALTKWEPRIEVLDVEASPDAVEPTALIVEVHYRTRATNRRYNLVYPFALSG